MQVAIKSLFAFCLFSSSVWAVEPTVLQAKPSSTNTTSTTAKPLTAEQIAKAKQQQEARQRFLLEKL